MSRCENLDGQCAKSWCNCDDVRKRMAEGSFAAPTGLAGHVAIPIVTEKGNRAIIKGDPNMPEATRKALAEMIDAVVKAANAGELKRPANIVLGQSGAKEKNANAMDKTT